MIDVIDLLVSLRRKEIMQNLVNTPEHVLLEAKRRQDIQRHNEIVEKKKQDRAMRRRVRNNLAGKAKAKLK